MPNDEPSKLGHQRDAFWECRVGDFIQLLGTEPQSVLDAASLSIPISSIQTVDAVFSLEERTNVGRVWVRRK